MKNDTNKNTYPVYSLDIMTSGLSFYFDQEPMVTKVFNTVVDGVDLLTD